MRTFRVEAFRPSDHEKGGNVRRLSRKTFTSIHRAAESARDATLEEGEQALITEWDEYGNEVDRIDPDRVACTLRPRKN